MKNWISKLAVVLFILPTLLFADSGNTNPKSKTVPPLSVQLWSVRDFIEKDFEGTLRRIAEMGFDGVELAGKFGRFADDPEGLKQFLASIGLVASGGHVSFEQLNPDNIHETLLFYKTLDVDLIIIPWDSRAWDPEKVHEMTEELTRLAPVVKKYGMSVGFHNHEKEFNEFKGTTFWDYIAQNTPDDVLLQLDVGWVNYAGKDSIEYVKRYPGRTLTTHYKIRTHEGSGDSPIIGDNGYHWDKLVEANIEYGGTRWIVVEQEEYPDGLSSMQSVEKSLAGLKKYLRKIK